MIVVSISGGKDSTATALLAINAYGNDQVKLVYADTGHEHPITTEYIFGYLTRLFNLPVHTVKADFSRHMERKRAWIEKHWADAGVTADRIKRALELVQTTGNPYLDLCVWKGRFPSRKAQFCTQELKAIPLAAFMLAEVRAGGDIEAWQGVRRDESSARANALDYEPACLDRPWAVRRPIVNWSAAQVFSYCASQGVSPNPLYLQGMRRVGCMPCINCGKDELLEISKRWPEEVERVAEWERLVADASKRGMATFFADPDGEGPARLAGEYARIHDVVAWSKTSRGGKQFDLLRSAPSDGCSSQYGLCE